MSDIDRLLLPVFFAQGQQPVLGQVPDNVHYSVTIVICIDERRDGLLPPGIGPALAECHQAQEDALRDRLVFRCQLRQGFIRLGGDRGCQAAPLPVTHGPVGAQRQQAAPSFFPQQHHGLLQQGERARFICGIGDELLNQAGFQVDLQVIGRSLDYRPEAFTAQRDNLQPLFWLQRPQTDWSSGQGRNRRAGPGSPSSPDTGAAC